MRVLVAPDKLKEAATAAAFADALARGVRRADPDAEIDVCPLADGGDGTVDALLAQGGERRTARVTGPLGEPVDAEWSLLADGTAVVESASAAGLAQVPAARRGPLHTTTRGVGELIRCALDAGALRVLVGVGGTATVDGGAGALEALGVVASPSPGRPLCGGDLASLDRVDRSGVDSRVRTVLVACDVTNPLVGADGAAAVYGPQKGASPDDVAALDRGLAHWARRLGLDPSVPGGGAGGGLAAGLVAIGARAVPGIDWILDRVGFAQRVARADLVLTGEGRLDAQTARGKVVAGVARAAGARGVPCVALCGRVETTDLVGLTAALALADGPLSLEQSVRDWERLAERSAEQVVRLFAAR